LQNYTDTYERSIFPHLCLNMSLETEDIDLEMEEKEIDKKRRASRVQTTGLNAAAEERRKKTKQDKDKHKEGDDKDDEEKETAKPDKDKKQAKKEAINRKKKEADFRPGQEKAISSLMKQTLKNSQLLRMLMGVVLEVFMVKTESQEAINMRKQTVAYSKLLETKDDLGPPNIYAFAGLIDSLVSRADEMNKETADDLANFKRFYDKADKEQRADLVRHCQLERVYRADLKKIVFAVRHNIQEAVAKALTTLGAERKQGRAPAGYLERDLQEWVEAIDS